MPQSRGATIFDSVKMSRAQSASFDLSHNKTFTLDMGKLYPTTCLEVLPGDSYRLSQENFLRFAPLISPVMHQINVKTYSFFVPWRLIWEEFPDWITGESTAEAPYITGLTTAAGWTNKCLSAHFAIPPSSAGFTTQKISPAVAAAYYKIYDEYFRDQNLIDEKFIPLVAGDNSIDYLDLMKGEPLRKAWEHDYFTSCLPWAQKGDPVQMPLINNGTASIDVTQWPGVPSGYPTFLNANDLTLPASGNISQAAAGASINIGAGANLVYDPRGTLEVDINAEAVTINTFRNTIRVQEWLEKNARGGTRYTENILAHFDTHSLDQRLQRPEYIGGSKQVMRISEVLSTAQTIDQSSNDVPVGQMAGHGISIGAANQKTYRATEHGFIISLICVQPKTAYYQGLHRMHQRFDKHQFAWPSFANLGEQEVYVKELRNDVGTEEELNTLFGYIPQYSEYKFMHDTIAGDFRDSLEFWQLARKWELDDLPALNEEFIECKPDKRIFAVVDDGVDSIYAQVFHNVHAVKKLPKYGVPHL